MPVTELALLHLTTPTRSPTPSPTIPIVPLLAAAMHTQDAWHRARFPHLPSSASSRAALWFRQVEDPSVLLTTARWESVAAHWDWIRSGENARVMAGLEGHVAARDTVLLHVGGDVFGGGGGGGSGSVPLVESPVVSVERMFVGRGARARFDARFGEVRRGLEECVSPHLVRFGWREDVEEEAEEDEFVLVWGGEGVDDDSVVVGEKGVAGYGEVSGLAARVELKHYKRLLLE